MGMNIKFIIAIELAIVRRPLTGHDINYHPISPKDTAVPCPYKSYNKYHL